MHTNKTSNEKEEHTVAECEDCQSKDEEIKMLKAKVESMEKEDATMNKNLEDIEIAINNTVKEMDKTIKQKNKLVKETQNKIKELKEKLL